MTSKASRSDQRKENFTRNIQFHAKKKRKREKIGSNKKNKNNFPRHEGISVCNNISTRGFPPITILLLYWIPPPFDLHSGITGIKKAKARGQTRGRERERERSSGTMKLENTSASKLLNNDHPRIEDGPTFARDYLQETTNPLSHYRETRMELRSSLALFLGYALYFSFSFFFCPRNKICAMKEIMRVRQYCILYIGSQFVWI